jgi:hypothetical protein
MMVRQGTPNKLHQGVVALCAKINPGVAPFYVQVTPSQGAGPTDCFLNVPNHIAAHGGALLHGWRINELPGIFVEGEFHGVWLSPAGEHVDVTPSQSGDTQILFLPDPGKTFDELAFTRRDNIRLALKDHPTVHAFIALCEEIYCYEEAHTDPRNPRKFTVKESEYGAMLQRKLEFTEQLALLPIGRNDPCRCASGLKYKKCCGR